MTKYSPKMDEDDRISPFDPPIRNIDLCDTDIKAMGSVAKRKQLSICCIVSLFNLM